MSSKKELQIWEGDLDEMNEEGRVPCPIYYEDEIKGFCWLDLRSPLAVLVDEVKSYLQREEEDFLIKLPLVFSWIPTAHCWGSDCDKNPINRLRNFPDGDYGHRCSKCQMSLRFHPFFGKGNEYDIGTIEGRSAWSRLTTEEKRAVHKKYGFR